MESTEEYDEFLKKVERTIYLDNISPAVTEPVLKAAIDQFGKVITVQFIHAYLQPNGIHAALVEVENKKQAETLINELESVPFMVGGCLGLSGPRLLVSRCLLIKLVKKHAEEVAFLLNEQVKEEEQLAKMQSHTLNGHHNKLKLIESISGEGKLRKLAQIYEIDI
ncbi:hypothetical protein SASPL_142394 [Salvia splendens]|uniref:RRM domain-containing protein n=1 Tax=Salvia splendens TaxID=180675 RepID=A0A8X8WJN6_SALSN|nr:hypothetical protein SASPL_142394 [Salvia splendens]